MVGFKKRIFKSKLSLLFWSIEAALARFKTKVAYCDEFLTVCKARILIWWNDINMKIMKPWWKDIKESAKLSGQIIKKESQQNLQLANHFVWFRPYKRKIDLGCLDFHNTSAPSPQMCAVCSKWRHSHRVFWLYLFKRHARDKKRERNKKKIP